MIILDTNVISAVMTPGRDSRVVSWLDRLPTGEAFTTSITIFEIAFGIKDLPDSHRRRQLMSDLIELQLRVFNGAILALDADAARLAADLAVMNKRSGRNIPFGDLAIAAIAVANSATLATRNIKHFEGYGLTLVNPWDTFK